MKLDFVHSPWAMRGYRLYSRLASLLMIAMGLGSSVEWALRINLVPDLGGRDMRLTAAFCVLLSGLALAAMATDRRWVRRLASLLCAIMIGLAANSLLEYGSSGYRGIARQRLWRRPATTGADGRTGGLRLPADGRAGAADPQRTGAGAA